jgi:tRNA pseudouridine55 synthase
VNPDDPAASGAVRRRWRAVDGIVLLDKPAGLTSTQALQRVRRWLEAEKAGHAGTLDPMATGMLPLCFGQATKACGQLLGRRKAYRATVLLGTSTDTGDTEGVVLARHPVPPFNVADVERAMSALRGERTQVPPMYSALKRDGRPLYELARQGQTVERAARAITIEELRLAGVDSSRIDIEVTCSKGTYIRVLAEELAAGLGTLGHLGALRRIWVEPFAAAEMVTLEQVVSRPWPGAVAGSPDWLLPVDRAFPDLPQLRLAGPDALHLRQGRVLEAPVGCTAAPHVRAYGADGEFLGLVEITGDHQVRVQRLFVAGAGSVDIRPSP